MGDLVVKVFEARGLPASKAPYTIDIRLVGDFGRQQRTQPLKGTENPIWNQGFQFKVRKQDIKVRFEILKLGTFSDTSVGVVEVAVGHLIAGVPSDMWLQFTKSAIQLHIEITFVPDFALQRDIAIQKALNRSPNGDFGTFISTGGGAVLSDINRTVDPTRPNNNNNPQTVYVTTTTTGQPAPGTAVVFTNTNGQQTAAAPGVYVMTGAPQQQQLQMQPQQQHPMYAQQQPPQQYHQQQPQQQMYTSPPPMYQQQQPQQQQQQPGMYYQVPQDLQQQPQQQMQQQPQFYPQQPQYQQPQQGQPQQYSTPPPYNEAVFQTPQ